MNPAERSALESLANVLDVTLEFVESDAEGLGACEDAARGLKELILSLRENVRSQSAYVEFQVKENDRLRNLAHQMIDP